MKSMVLPALVISSLMGILHADPISAWSASGAREEGSLLVLPDKLTGNDFTGDAQNVTIAEAAKEGHGKRALVFSGDVAAPLKTRRGIEAPATFTAELTFYPDSGGEATQTLVKHNTFEFRVDTAKSTISFIVWHDSNVFSTTSIPILLGTWNTVTATVDDERITISSKDQNDSKELKGPLINIGKPTSIVMGASGLKRDDGNGNRSFTGNIAEFKLTEGVKK